MAEQLRDLQHAMSMHRKLAKLRQKAFVQANNIAFRNVYIEIRTEMSDADALLAYVSRLKYFVQMQVMLHNSADLL